MQPDIIYLINRFRYYLFDKQISLIFCTIIFSTRCQQEGLAMGCRQGIPYYIYSRRRKKLHTGTQVLPELYHQFPLNLLAA